MSPVSRQWRSLDQLADDPSFVSRVAQEFPSLADALALGQRVAEDLLARGAGALIAQERSRLAVSAP